MLCTKLCPEGFSVASVVRAGVSSSAPSSRGNASNPMNESSPKLGPADKQVLH